VKHGPTGFATKAWISARAFRWSGIMQSSSLRGNVPVLQMDADFDILAQHTTLRVAAE